jgi:hypothetical protein
MKPASLVVVLVLAGSAGSIAALGACNAVLGIERATLLDAGSDDGANGDGGSGDGGGGSPDPLTCANYCSVIMENCSGSNLEYLSSDVCLAMCRYLAPGTFYPYPSGSADNVDSLGCRLWHAHSAAADPKTHCRHAGPLGADLCGGPCEPFCNLDWRFCADDNSISPYEGGMPECQTVCNANFQYAKGDSGDLVDDKARTIETGNTLNCRLWHLETAMGTGMVDPHCYHTAQVSATCQ